MASSFVNLQQHWDNVYSTKPLDTVSWYQAVPQPSLDLVQAFSPDQALPLRMIDVGGGDAYLTDYLLKSGQYKHTVLDISSVALARHRKRLGAASEQINYEVSNIFGYKPKLPFDIWHDRAVFHFLTANETMQQYALIAREGIRIGGILIIGAFATSGPESCSGLAIRKHNAISLDAVFDKGFKRQHLEWYPHETPSGSIQEFVFAVYERVNT